jgi:hypothetical protein
MALPAQRPLSRIATIQQTCPTGLSWAKNRHQGRAFDLFQPAAAPIQRQSDQAARVAFRGALPALRSALLAASRQLLSDFRPLMRVLARGYFRSGSM